MMKAIWILWPSFVVAGVAEAAFFTVFDPADLHLLEDASRTAVYTVGFFLFWSLAAASSAFTCFLQRRAVDINRLCPLAPESRPAGCPKRTDAYKC